MGAIQGAVLVIDKKFGYWQKFARLKQSSFSPCASAATNIKSRDPFNQSGLIF